MRLNYKTALLGGALFVAPQFVMGQTNKATAAKPIHIDEMLLDSTVTSNGSGVAYYSALFDVHNNQKHDIKLAFQFSDDDRDGIYSENDKTNFMLLTMTNPVHDKKTGKTVKHSMKAQIDRVNAPGTMLLQWAEQQSDVTTITSTVRYKATGWQMAEETFRDVLFDGVFHGTQMAINEAGQKYLNKTIIGQETSTGGQQTPSKKPVLNRLFKR